MTLSHPSPKVCRVMFGGEITGRVAWEFLSLINRVHQLADTMERKPFVCSWAEEGALLCGRAYKAHPLGQSPNTLSSGKMFFTLTVLLCVGFCATAPLAAEEESLQPMMNATEGCLERLPAGKAQVSLECVCRSEQN
ncbi:hypothetical protein CEXT_425911 [Caerostris extrusa]|uniref:Uncharacterized protein n=1 Tax=Caerostris extrusa TaxID=172846 RepID=A0AAV4WG69_CAEEX|nr:hypothetical protein CEXT_425911 [Caerostris extrusa]